MLLVGLAGCPPSGDDDDAVDADGDGFFSEASGGDDCNDGDSASNPAADEVCDGADNDCDGAVDEDAIDALTFYADGDGDGFGAGDAILACSAPTGASETDDDCDDGDASVFPEAPEDDCTDPTDYDCDGAVDYADVDEDGVAACEDCDDEDADAAPGLDEICDGVDNDCDGTVDEDDAVGAPDWFLDGDGDGIGAGEPAFACAQPGDRVPDGDDCDDGDPSVFPGAPETDCTDPTDYNCDGSVAFADVDGDGAPACEDCDDGDAAEVPGGVEICDGLDNDCLGGPDDGLTFADWYFDADMDGFGTGLPSSTCDGAPFGSWTNDGGDCNDGNASVNPGATEVCDGVDNNCVSGVDEGFDGDNDGVTSCAGDCDDGDPNISPNAPEIPYDTIDNDCVGGDLTDVDGDGFDGIPAGGDDCDDNEPGTNPGVAVDVFDGADNDCDTVVDEGPFTYTYAADVQPILTANCTSSQCHDAIGPDAGLDLTASAYSRLVNAPSGQASMDLVEPLDPALSYLLHKLNNTQFGVGGSGQAMPRGAPLLPLAQRQLVETWIAEGAVP